MKKLILSLLILTMVVAVFCSGGVKISADTTAPAEKAVVKTIATASSIFPNDISKALMDSTDTNVVSEPAHPTPSVDSECIIETVEPESVYYHSEIPLSREEQDMLGAACEEFDIPYGIALGLIEKETHFRNALGDDGASAGYMQIQEKWHWDRMGRLGVTDLFDPEGNFRVGCDFLAELYGKYGDWGVALTVYNRGHDPGFISDYAYEVLENYAKWQELVKTND